MHSSHMHRFALGQPLHNFVDGFSYAATRRSGFIVERLHLLEGKLVSENLIASFPFDRFLVMDFDLPTTAPVAYEQLAIRHSVWLPHHSKPVLPQVNTDDMKPHAGRERIKNVLEPSFEIVDGPL